MTDIKSKGKLTWIFVDILRDIALDNKYDGSMGSDTIDLIFYGVNKFY